MSHVDEGALHAYLDGALDEYPPAEARRIREHVETCAACGERLAEERKVRDEAHAILSKAAPEVTVPTFEELRAYVRAQQPRTKVSVRVYRLSWAASVVLALGTGYVLRGGEAVPIAPLGQPRPAETAAADAVEQQPAEEEADVPTFAAPPAAEVTLEQAAGAGAVSPLGRAEPAAPSAVPQAAPAVAEPLVDARRFDDVAAGGAAVGVGAVGAPAGALAPSAQQAPQPTDARVAERIDSAARANQAERRVAAQDQVVTSALSADAAAPAQRQRSANEETTRDEDSVSLVIPGLEVLDVLPVGEGTTFAGMRALQRLESGDTLEVVHLPEGIDPSLLPPLRPDLRQLVRPRGAGWLVMRAPVSERYLEELLQRLEAGR